MLSVVLFGPANTLDCPDTADSDDDGRLTIADAIFILGFLFQDSSRKPKTREPFPHCGPDPTADELYLQATNGAEAGGCVYPRESCADR